MGECVEKISHSCGSLTGLQVFEDEDGSHNGYCYACGVYVPDPYNNKPDDYKPPKALKKSPEGVAVDLAEIDECGALTLHDRRLNESTLSYFGDKVGVNPVDGETPHILYRPYTKDGELRAYKCKLLGKKGAWSVGDQSEVDLYGWEQAIRTGSKTLYITEGEEDAKALWQVLTKNNKGTDYEEFVPAVCSLPHGAGAAVKDLLRLKAKINKHFQNVVLAFDMDKPGQEASSSVTSKVFPKAKTALLPSKDANDALMEGKAKALVKSVLWNAKEQKNTKLVWGGDVHKEAMVQAGFGVSWPFTEITRLTRGIRKGETIYIGSAQKMGLVRFAH